MDAEIEKTAPNLPMHTGIWLRAGRYQKMRKLRKQNSIQIKEKRTSSLSVGMEPVCLIEPSNLVYVATGIAFSYPADV